MHFVKFYNPDGSLQKIVNLSDIVSVSFESENSARVLLHGAELVVDRKQLLDAIDKLPAGSESMPLVLTTRLIQALDRLCVKIPTSIRLHM